MVQPQVPPELPRVLLPELLPVQVQELPVLPQEPRPE
jgi:hypothetical protein